MKKKPIITEDQMSSNPALAFIGEKEEAPKQPAVEQIQQPAQTPTMADIRANVPDGYKINPLYIEKKSQRVQLVLRPSLYQRARETAEAQGISFNELVHRALAEYLGDREEGSK